MTELIPLIKTGGPVLIIAVLACWFMFKLNQQMITVATQIGQQVVDAVKQLSSSIEELSKKGFKVLLFFVLCSGIFWGCNAHQRTKVKELGVCIAPCVQPCVTKCIKQVKEKRK